LTRHDLGSACQAFYTTPVPFTNQRADQRRDAENARYDRRDMASRDTRMDARRFTLISKALADPKRFEMLRRIGEAKEAPTCSYIRDSLHLAAATISHHLKELESAGLVHVERNGKFAYISLQRDVLKAYLRRLASI
jgi:ArsR family transcriptional regulator